MTFTDSLYLADKIELLICETKEMLGNLPMDQPRNIISEIDNILHNLRSVKTPVMSTLPPLIVSFNCQESDGAIFAFLRIPAQDLIYNQFCPGKLYNKSTSAKLKFVSKNDASKKSECNFAAQVTLQAWAYNKSEGCPANEIDRKLPVWSCAVMHKYEEGSLFNWQPGRQLLLGSRVEVFAKKCEKCLQCKIPLELSAVNLAILPHSPKLFPKYSTLLPTTSYNAPTPDSNPSLRFCTC